MIAYNRGVINWHGEILAQWLARLRALRSATGARGCKLIAIKLWTFAMSHNIRTYLSATHSVCTHTQQVLLSHSNRRPGNFLAKIIQSFWHTKCCRLSINLINNISFKEHAMFSNRYHAISKLQFRDLWLTLNYSTRFKYVSSIFVMMPKFSSFCIE